MPVLKPLAAALSLALAAGTAHADVNTLVGFSLLPANTFSNGPTSGQFAGAGAGGNPLPLIDKQPVQGFSAVLSGPTPGSYYVMPDNGFGAKTNSADALLRVYSIKPAFKTATGGTGTVGAVNYSSGAGLASFNNASHITLADPNRKLGFTIQADYDRYYNNAANPLVNSSIKAGRLLTGADFDIESVRKDKNGNLWFGEEFGPFLVKTNANGVVQRQEIALPGVQAPQNPYLNGGTPNLGQSRGFEGMAINPAGDKLYTLLEGTVTGDPAKSLRINEFSIDTESYTGKSFMYQLEASGTNIGDMTAINNHQFLVIERNGDTATTPGGNPFKKIFLADIGGVANGGTVTKTEVVDLMNIADPNDLNGDGNTKFTFPFVTIESVLPLDKRTLLVLNDNNYPGVGGRNAGSDNNEMLLIHLARPLDLANPVPEPSTYAMMAGGLGLIGLMARRRRATR